MKGHHGHLIPRADGQRARCGGAGFCDVCAMEEKFVKVRTALLALIGIEDDLLELCKFKALMQTLPGEEDKRVSIGAVETLIKTHPEYQS